MDRNNIANRNSSSNFDATVTSPSPRRIGRHLGVERRDRCPLRTNLFVNSPSHVVIDDTPNFGADGEPDVLMNDQNVEKDNGPISTEVRCIVENLVIHKARDKRTPLEHIKEWAGFISDLREELKSKRQKNNFKEVVKLRRSQKETYKRRVGLLEFLGNKLFGSETLDQIVSFLFCYMGKPFKDAVSKNHRDLQLDGIGELKISPEEALAIHFESKVSYTQQFNLFASLKRKLPKDAIDFPTKGEVVAYKRQLLVPPIKKFRNLEGKEIGRVSLLSDVLQYEFSNKDVVKNCNFFISDANIPKVLICNHTDGARQSLSVELVSILLRIINLNEVSRNPFSQLILALEQSHESGALFDLLFKACEINEGLEHLYKHGLDVVCLEESCTLCTKEIPRFKKPQPDGKSAWYHTVSFVLFYVWDRKAHNRKLGLRDGYCQNCHAALGKESYKNCFEPTRKSATLTDYIAADEQFRNSLEDFRQTKKRAMPDSIHHIDFDEFKESSEYMKYEEKVGRQYFGFCVDKHTPLEYHITGTLHSEIHFAEFLMELGYILAQEVERLHPGLGVHSQIQGLRFAGLPHEAVRVKEHATQNFKGKVRTFAAAGKSALGCVSVEKAIALEFKKWISGAAPIARLKELLKQVAPLSKPPASRKQLQDLLLNKLSSMKDAAMLKLLKHAEQETFDRKVNSRLVHKFLVHEGQKELNVRNLVGASAFKINGRDARSLIKGGAMTMYHQMDAFLIELRIKNREALDFNAEQILALEMRCSESEALVSGLCKKLSSLSDLSPEYCPASDDLTSELGSMFDQLEEYDSEISAFREEIIGLGQEALKLYSCEPGFQMNDISQKVIRIAACFIDLISPILYPVSDNVDTLLEDLVDYEERASKFLGEIKSSNLNIDFKEHSYYMHSLILHAVKECRFVLEVCKCHISNLNEQTSEHLNKILKALLVKLQGFTNRAVGGGEDAADDTLNKMGYVMRENFLQNFHFFDSLVRKRRPPKCGLCDEVGHYQRSCKKPCTKCKCFYFKGHNKGSCGLSLLPTSPLKTL